ncbi:WcbI family polysaccharide biosynthesis putative acetyltransferase [Kosakonia sacchari]|uniref:WcbI family polysaccharide biosynthesis putative acetyltransferase n=1 Tax=Kosakonia sacchari TaxID=1158459 RepID=A0ABZ0MUE5_9ENTR|nr:WcbI family polysaccharide biosynthesis putative acetyltransferase [Kosakonia sacchari]WOZ79129.1 WcbI family polysaccharide biosynthesis putative acetyltransferase [Kosakonia sacchari]
MKLALIGNCQLEVLGNLIMNVSGLHEGKFDGIFNMPIYKLNENNDFINFYHELEQCDFIFMQHHAEKWGPFSTAALSQFFDITMLPTMESRISTPQLGYYKDKIPDFMVYVDYRMLHLYLTNVSIQNVVEAYHAVSFSTEKQTNMLKEDALKYRTLFQQGKLYFDYSEEYFRTLSANPDCYSTVSHPDNYNLSLLLQVIYHKSLGINESFDLQGNDLLKNYLAPKIGSGDNAYHMMRPTGLALAGKINYAFFDSQNRHVLKQALVNSSYYISLEDRYQNL